MTSASIARQTTAQAQDIADHALRRWTAAFDRADWSALTSLYTADAHLFGSKPTLYAGSDGVHEYFSQLAAEKLVTRFKGHRPEHEWVKVRPRNEALDCLVYALAACRLSGRALDAPRRRAVPGQSGGILDGWKRGGADDRA